MARYRPITRQAFAAVMADMGMVEVDLPGSKEHVYERAITRKDGTISRFLIRICSSVHIGTGVTRECGDDAIRILLIDTKLKDYGGRPKIVQDWRTFRTENALSNLRERARDAWRYALANGCECGAVMVERRTVRGTFMGCTDYPTCKRTRSLVCDKVAA